jgi:serine/threonine-protein kinase RsbW
MKNLILPAVMENLDALIDFFIDGAKSVGFDGGAINKINLACEEALVNVINYAYQGKTGDIEVTLTPVTDGNGIVFGIIDSGIEFNPLHKAEPDINAPIEERPIGGLGIFLVRKIMDNVEYRRDAGKNILTMTKYVN